MKAYIAIPINNENNQVLTEAIRVYKDEETALEVIEKILAKLKSYKMDYRYEIKETEIW